MFSLNPRDLLLIVAILVAMVVGAAIKHWRDARREGVAVAGGHERVQPVRIQQTPGRGEP